MSSFLDPLSSTGSLSLSDSNGPLTTSGSLASASGESLTAVKARAATFEAILQADVVNVGDVKHMAMGGIPDRGGLRPRAWKLLLGYLPADSSLWRRTKEERRDAYHTFCQELIVNPQEADVAAYDDHPLSQSTSSKWNAFFKDAEMMEQIDRDVMRTHPDMHFFSVDDPTTVQHREEMKRALFIFAKLNTGLQYVQGMNELLAPLYYQFRTDPDEAEAAQAEADAFYCFMDLISEFGDNFCQQLDNSGLGIKASLGRLNSALEATDPQLWHHVFVKNKVNPQFYAFRWITLLLTQEFPFPDTVRIWDTLFSDPSGRSNCLLRLCVAMLLNVREQLLEGDFSHNLKLLQKYPPVDVHAILSLAGILRI